MNRQPPYFLGSWVKVKHSLPYLLLPEELPEGASVKIIAVLTDGLEVEHRGKRFKVATDCIDRHQVETPE